MCFIITKKQCENCASYKSVAKILYIFSLNLYKAKLIAFNSPRCALAIFMNLVTLSFFVFCDEIFSLSLVSV